MYCKSYGPVYSPVSQNNISQQVGKTGWDVVVCMFVLSMLTQIK